MKRLWVAMAGFGIWAGCGDEGPGAHDVGADVVSDTASAVDGAADTTSGDVLADSSGVDTAGPEARSVLGTWKVLFRTGWYAARYTYTFSGGEDGGTLEVRFEQTDWNLELAGCTRVDDATGTWTLVDGQLDVVPEAGTTARWVTFGEPDCGIGEDMSYPERPLDAAELRALDLADGPLGWVEGVEGPRLVTEREGYQYEWTRP